MRLQQLHIKFSENKACGVFSEAGSRSARAVAGLRASLRCRRLWGITLRAELVLGTPPTQLEGLLPFIFLTCSLFQVVRKVLLHAAAPKLTPRAEIRDGPAVVLASHPHLVSKP